MMTITASNVVVKTNKLNVYKFLDEETAAVVVGDVVSIWAIDGDESIQLTAIRAGSSGLSTDQLIAKVWNA